MHCLQTKLVPEATGMENTTCEAMKHKALGTHAGCYVESGLCTLPPAHWVTIMEIVELRTIFASWDTFKATTDAELGCGEFYAVTVESSEEIRGRYSCQI
jgi:hypothetical protein